MIDIIKLKALEILDSRGIPTLQVSVALADGSVGVASVPSGASTGSHEAHELRDGDSKRYLGKGVQRAIEHVRTDLSRCLLQQSFPDLQSVDQAMCELDGTPNKSSLGANTILAVSLAVAKAHAISQDKAFYQYLSGGANVSLPVPMMNIINGGAHANNNIDIQEFMIIPAGFDCFSESLRAGVETFQALKSLLNAKSFSTAVGDEGGFSPNFDGHEMALDFIMEAISCAGFKPHDEICLALDVAATELFSDGYYHLSSTGQRYDAGDFAQYLKHLVNQYPIVSIEDAMSEEDWSGWAHITQLFGDQIQLVGDDLFVTHTERLSRGVREGAANSILIKPNQVGTLTETIAAIKHAQSSGFGVVVSHRSGETEDTSIADIAVGCSSGQIKTGSLCRSERIAKYNRLLSIEQEIGSNAKYPGLSIFDSSDA
jgi:enolase